MNTAPKERIGPTTAFIILSAAKISSCLTRMLRTTDMAAVGGWGPPQGHRFAIYAGNDQMLAEFI